jgi:hypothetical protein
MKLIVENLTVRDVVTINNVARIQLLILDSLRSASQFEPEKTEVDKSIYVR